MWCICLFCLFVRLFCNIAPESLGTSEEDGASTRSSSLPQWQLSRNARQETKSDIRKVSYAVGTHLLFVSQKVLHVFSLQKCISLVIDSCF